MKHHSHASFTDTELNGKFLKIVQWICDEAKCEHISVHPQSCMYLTTMLFWLLIIYFLFCLERWSTHGLALMSTFAFTES